MPKPSARSAGATYLNRAERIVALQAAAARAAAELPSIRRVILFGSLVSGTPTPRSDADLLVEVTGSLHSEPRHRVPEVLRAFSPLPCPLDLFVLTTREIETHQATGARFLEAVLATGLVLFERAG